MGRRLCFPSVGFLLGKWNESISGSGSRGNCFQVLLHRKAFCLGAEETFDHYVAGRGQLQTKRLKLQDEIPNDFTESRKGLKCVGFEAVLARHGDCFPGLFVEEIQRGLEEFRRNAARLSLSAELRVLGSLSSSGLIFGTN